MSLDKVQLGNEDRYQMVSCELNDTNKKHIFWWFQAAYRRSYTS